MYTQVDLCEKSSLYPKDSGRVFENLGIVVADKTSNFLKNSLGNPKDELDNLQKMMINLVNPLRRVVDDTGLTWIMKKHKIQALQNIYFIVDRSLELY